MTENLPPTPSRRGLPQGQGASADPIIVFDRVRKSYGDAAVLNDLEFSVGAGEKVAIIGPSGSGKTTILRVLMTLAKPDAGVVYVDGEPLWQRQKGDKLVPANEAHLRRMRGKIGMVFQHFNLFPNMSVLRNVTEAPMHVRGTPRKQAEARAKELLELYGLGDKLHAFPAQLSGGQKQRVAIARACALEPKIMLFDEVTSALDPELFGEVLNILRQLALETRMTMLIVTHEMRFAREVSDRVVFFDAGQVAEAGEPSRLFSAPQNPRTQAFLRAVLEH